MSNHLNIQNKSKFISPTHIGYNSTLTLEVLKPQDLNQYRLTNVIQMQVADLQLALQIYLNQKKEVTPQSKYIYTLDKSAQIALWNNSKEEESTNKDTIQKDFYNAISSILPNKQETLDISAIMVELASFLNEKDIEKSMSKIDTRFNEIKSNLESYKNKTFNIDNIKDCDLSDTKEMLNKAQIGLEKVVNKIEEYASMAQKDLDNKFKKDSIILGANIFITTHAPILAHILVHKLGSDMAKILFRICLGGISGPIGIIISIALLLVEILYFFVNKYQEDKRIAKAYRLYGTITSIYENIDYSLASLLNFGSVGFGNLITTQNKGTLTYHLYPNLNTFSSIFIYEIMNKNTLNFKDISYKTSISLQKEKIQNDIYLQRIFENNNEAPSHTSNITNTQFSTFSFQDAPFIKDGNTDFTKSSAFQHFKNIFLKFDSFLFVKTSSFSSILANDILMQSFKTSHQNNPARINKTALFLTNCLHNGTPEYKVQEHIKTILQNNENTKKNVLFLSAIYRVEKSVIVKEFLEQMKDLFNKLEKYAYMNQTQQIHYLTRHIGSLIDKYKVGKVSYYGFSNYITSYSLDDSLINNLEVNEFCNFMYELCMVFITRRHVDMVDKYMDNFLLKLYWYRNNEQKYQEAKTNIKDIFIKMNTIITDISKILSHFNAFSFAKLQQYQKEIDGIYEQQKKSIEDFFDTQYFQNTSTQSKEHNVFYHLDSIKELCIGVLNRYWNKNQSKPFASLEYLLQRYQKIQFDSLESSVKNRDEREYTNILKSTIDPILPLDDSILNCLSDEEMLYFYAIIISEVKQYQNNNQKLQNLIGSYYIALAMFELLTTQDKKTQDKIYKIYNNSNMQGLLEAILNGMADIGKDSATKIVKDLLKEKYPISSSLMNDNLKDVLKDLATNLATIQDAKNLDIKQLNSLTEFATHQKLYNAASIITIAIIDCVASAMLDKFFPTQIKNIEAMKQLFTSLLVGVNRHRDTPYATCKRGSKYLTLPIEIAQTLINADIQAMIIGGSPLNSGFCIHTPSVAIFSENKENALKTLKETLRHFMNDRVNIDKIGEKAGEIVKEAYAKLWFYLDMGENKQLETYLRNEVKVDPKYYTLNNIASDAYIATKLKITQDKANQSFAENNKEENFITMEGNAKGKIRFNRDFLIQLKRVAEWNYRVYEEKEVLPQIQNEKERIAKLSTKDPSPDEWLGGNLIYDKGFIPTTIDIRD